MPGYEVDFSQTKIDEQLSCPFCRLILKIPYQSLCGHRYCYPCIEEMRGHDKSFICVLDGAHNKENEIFPDRFVQRQLNTLVVYCKNAPVGCPWKGPLKEYEFHLESCAYHKNHCPNSDKGCKEVVPKDKVEKHLGECEYRTVTCDSCKEEMLYAVLKDHRSTVCPMIKVKCPNCKKDVARSKLESHKTHDCEEGTAKCPFTAIGCGATRAMKKQERKKHSENAMLVHLTYLLQTVLQLRDQVMHKEDKLGTSFDEEAVKEKFSCLEKSLMEEMKDLRERVIGVEACATTTVGPAEHPKQCKSEKSKESMLVPKNHLREEKIKDNLVTSTSGACAVACTSTSDDVKAVSPYQSAKGTFDSDAFHDLLSECHRVAKKVGDLEKSVDALRQLHANRQQSLVAYEKDMAQKDVHMVELADRITMVESSSYDGQIIFAITNFAAKRQSAIMGRATSIYSAPFYTSRHGYRLRMRVYLNGDGMGKGTHVSLYIVIERGLYDALLPWPFRQRVTFTIVDQNNKDHVIDSFRPDPASSSFHRPRKERNIASGCPLFMPLSYLDSRGVVKDDVMFIRGFVETSGVKSQKLHWSLDDDRVTRTKKSRKKERNCDII